MEIKTKYEIGQHIWVVHVNHGEVCVYDAKINSIDIDKDGVSYWTKEGVDYREENLIPYEETDKLADEIKELMQQIHEREEKENA